ncbi:hypothetical protein [Tunturiibacter gelidoferens]|uniref:Site-specific recombinase XerC n=1 Tax=Tunturiibacter gelidiferens TaxID=3069689 RepID=A0ACC5P3V9_9BACT|nr:hypothetical protein [Edaphobacter lichenicola]MBB5341485.1 site-specific recombinase XerC [Edaphobacter lichenicola]
MADQEFASTLILRKCFREASFQTVFSVIRDGRHPAFQSAALVRGPKHVAKVGKRPVLQPDEARALLDSIDVSTAAGLRDRALLGAMVFSFARVSAVVAMDAGDYYQQGKRW